MMKAIYRCVAGFDVHSKTVAVCILAINELGEVVKQIRTFGTMTRDLRALSDWLTAEHVTHVAMESTGVFWKPIYNILEGQFEILLVNARHVKNVPGRKTDIKDCEWLAQLLQCGLLKGSFIPPRPQRELRDLTRMRTQLTHEMTAVANRVHKILEDTNVKLGLVATDILGVSGRKIIWALIDGETDTAKMAEMAVGRMRSKIALLRHALEGKVTEHHRFLLKALIEHISFLEGHIELYNQRIEVACRPFEQAIQALVPIPGFNLVSAQNVIAEIGSDMSRWPTHGHFGSWAKISPGNNKSAGKKRSAGTGNGNPWLVGTLIQVAWAATHKKDSYFRAQFCRLAGRRGKTKAIVAVGHSILTTVYCVLKTGNAYHDLGVDYFDRLQRDKIAKYHVRRLEALGYKVQLSEQEAA